MADKSQELITKYLGDMISLESHIVQAIDKQAKWLDDHQDVKAKVSAYRTTLSGHVDALKARLETRGGSPTHPLKEGVAAAVGVAAGVVDKMRGSEAAKDLRDDYTAINLAIVSYIMMHTTAVAGGDLQTAALCKQHLQDNARMVMEINNFIPEIVVAELRQDGMSADPSAVEKSKQVNHEIWNQPARA